MGTRIANILSYVLHPLLMPTYGIFTIFQLNIYPISHELKIAIYSVVFLTTFVLPIIFVPILKYMYVINNIKLESKRERLYPLALTTMCYIFGYYLIAYSKVRVPELIAQLFIGSIITMIIALLITIKWKISTHTAGIGGILGLVFSLIFKFYIDVTLYFQIVLVLCGIVGFARLKLKAHTPAQVYWGFALGFVCLFTVGLFELKL